MKCFTCLVLGNQVDALTVFNGEAMCAAHVSWDIALRRRILGEVTDPVPVPEPERA